LGVSTLAFRGIKEGISNRKYHIKLLFHGRPCLSVAQELYFCATELFVKKEYDHIAQPFMIDPGIFRRNVGKYIPIGEDTLLPEDSAEGHVSPQIVISHWIDKKRPRT